MTSDVSMIGNMHSSRKASADRSHASGMANTSMNDSSVETATAAIAKAGTLYSGSAELEAPRFLTFLTSKAVCKATSRRERTPMIGPATVKSNTRSVSGL
jgi:hypothetical protein